MQQVASCSEENKGLLIASVWLNCTIFRCSLAGLLSSAPRNVIVRTVTPASVSIGWQEPAVKPELVVSYAVKIKTLGNDSWNVSGYKYRAVLSVSRDSIAYNLLLLMRRKWDSSIPRVRWYHFSSQTRCTRCRWPPCAERASVCHQFPPSSSPFPCQVSVLQFGPGCIKHFRRPAIC